MPFSSPIFFLGFIFAFVFFLTLIEFILRFTKIFEKLPLFLRTSQYFLIVYICYAFTFFSCTISVWLIQLSAAVFFISFFSFFICLSYSWFAYSYVKIIQEFFNVIIL